MGAEVAGVSANKEFGMGVSGSGNGIRGRAGNPAERWLTRESASDVAVSGGGPLSATPAVVGPGRSGVALGSCSWTETASEGSDIVSVSIRFEPSRSPGVFFCEWFSRARGM
jgi:hypothetical protein